VLGTVNWDAVGAIAGIVAGLFVVGGAVVKVGQGWLLRGRAGARRIDMLEIRLFGLPPDPITGAKKLDGEFDRIDKRLDEMPDQVTDAVMTALKNDA
jgi:hypothetical protein